jgi:ABC-type uncharacterized transport system involved in gliding motility auxiliary subunit
MDGARWQRASFGVGGLIALAVTFLAVVMLANVALRGVRLDLTQNHLYTLSPGTTEVVRQLQEPVNLVFYFSRDAATKQSPLILPYATRVRELLEEVAARSDGKIRLRVVDPQAFSEDEDRANAAGVQALPSGGSGDPLFFGLAGTNSTDGHGVIPSFQQEREPFLEYDVAKLIQELGQPRKPVIGLLSSINMQGQMDPMSGQMSESWPIVAEIEQLFTLRQLAPELDRIEPDVDVLMVVLPKSLPDKTLYAIDQFVMRGGRLLLFLDPVSGADRSAQDPQNPMAAAMAAATASRASDLEPLLAAWGVVYDPKQVIGDLQLGLDVRTSMQEPPLRHIAILGLHHADMNAKDVVTGSLETINMATAGFLTQKPGAKTSFEPLLLSSSEAAPIPASRFVALANPETLRDGFKPTGIRYALAARVTGNLESAFPGGPPAALKPPTTPPAAHLTKTSAPANLVIVADTDMLLDFMWVQVREVFGQRVAQTFANNGDFVANILDNLSGSGALISIRGRESFNRPFERIEALKRQADDRLRAKSLELQAELKQTESKLDNLQSKRADQASLALSPEQEAEIKNFTAAKTQIRRDLRETQRGLDVDIERLESRIKVIDTAVMPLAVAILGFFVLRARRRHDTGAGA